MRAVGGRNENRLSRRCPKLRGLVFWGGRAHPRAVLRLVRDGILQVWGQCWGGKWGRHRWLMAGCPCQRGGWHLWHRHSAADPLHHLGGSQTCALMPPPVVVCLAVPPQIVNISSDITVNEGSSVTLMCLAFGRPEPTVTWRHLSGKGEGRRGVLGSHP